MHFVLAVVSCSCSLLFLREIKQIAGQGTTKEYVCLHTTGRCLCYRQLINDRPRDRLQLLISRPARQDVQEEMQILFLIQIEAWDKSDSKNKFQTPNKGQLGNIKKGKTSILRKFFSISENSDEILIKNKSSYATTISTVAPIPRSVIASHIGF